MSSGLIKGTVVTLGIPVRVSLTVGRSLRIMIDQELLACLASKCEMWRPILLYEYAMDYNKICRGLRTKRCPRVTCIRTNVLYGLYKYCTKNNQLNGAAAPAARCLQAVSEFDERARTIINTVYRSRSYGKIVLKQPST